MLIDKYGQFVYSEQELCDLYLTNPEIKLSKTLVESEIFNTLNLDNFPQLEKYVDPNISIETFDSENQNKWLMPEEYVSMDIAKWVLEQCKDESELQRAGHELLLFQERDMFPLLQYLKYLVDTMRQHNIVWGVGRGSSVASFVLFLIGIHKINSLYYDLPIEEFLK